MTKSKSKSEKIDEKVWEESIHQLAHFKDWNLGETIRPDFLDTTVGASAEPEDSPVPWKELPKFTFAGETEAAFVESSAEFQLRELIAEGGMGQIYLADQLPLRREVAVKVALPGESSSKNAQQLLYESWLTGRLQHPNIVPVYQLGRDAEDMPILAMKHIKGTPWSVVLATDRYAKKQATHHSLAWHIRILIQVCHAIDFAHSKGILHRDLKPDNVMVGEFGEVYVLDWGIAVSLNEEDRGHIPLAKESTTFSGTLAYAAPEMLSKHYGELSPQTDVYLLGAMLHELLTDSPPHYLTSMDAAMFSVLRSKPREYEPEVPRSLVKICRQAMHRSPEKRHPNVKAFRLALEEYLRFNESEILSTESQGYLEELKNILKGEQGGQDEIYNLFGRAHFGFRRALEIHENNQNAQQGFQQLLERMITYALDNNDTQSPAKWLNELPQPQPDLQQRWEAQHKAYLQSMAQAIDIKQLIYDQDIRVGAQARSMILQAIALLWLFFCLGVHYTQSKQWYQPSHEDFLIVNFFFGLFVVTSAWVGRSSFLQNKTNRQIVKLLLLFVALLITQRLAFLALNITFYKTAILEFAIFFFFVSILAALYDLRILFSSLVYIAALILSIQWDQYLYVWMALSHAFAMTIIARIWAGKEYDSTEPVQT